MEEAVAGVVVVADAEEVEAFLLRGFMGLPVWNEPRSTGKMELLIQGF